MRGVTGQWVLLAYRIPRQPSTLRITIWRKLDRLGVARLGDGLVALPADARTREQLEWIAEEIGEMGGSSTLWLAAPGSQAQEQATAAEMRQARVAEYRAVIAQVEAAAHARPGERARAVKRLQAELRRIGRRDYFPPPEREEARLAVRALAQEVVVKEESR
ncbi:Chromate resistance protein ChrB [Nonomuraea turcica]|uniref:Chromate resistance protein ChrB n=1 Tax=Nonomuraea sp. G32 TaxID=3067274 RepID=UPI00273A952D|nr:Chromate resistance protein ChrB [Nonomuraea sp. G32]MDP4505463.1 hypothetical protein [Nonomuraea sp. G32]